MSILLSPRSSDRISPSRSFGWFLLYFVCVIGGGALLGAVLIRFGQQMDGGFWPELIAEHGPARVLRRLQTLLAVALAPWMLRKIGWRGFHDLGWASSSRRDTRWTDFKGGFLLGLAVMAAIAATSLLLGVRSLLPFDGARLASSLFAGFLITGLGVGLIEETLTRGVLYRSMARAWSPWTAAIVSSLLFAWAHFMKASPESFALGPFEVLRSSLFDDLQRGTSPLKCLNMFLFGLVLCRLVYHRGDIWAAVGLHASAVGLIRVISKNTDYDRALPLHPWIGHSAKFDDGWLLSLLLFVLILFLELSPRLKRDSR
jgi:membrane protease YdiL (CAAX protease family)